jgi:hypothetical protein
LPLIIRHTTSTGEYSKKDSHDACDESVNSPCKIL